MELTEYIDKYFNGNKTEFARHEGVLAPQVHKWIAMECIVVNGRLYSPRRDMNPIELKE